VRSWEENCGPGVTFEIECKQKGKSIIHYHTAGDAEQEVLFPPSTKFLITKVAKKSDGEDLVWMTEIVDEPSMTDVVAALVVPPVDTLHVLGWILASCIALLKIISVITRQWAVCGCKESLPPPQSTNPFIFLFLVLFVQMRSAGHVTAFVLTTAFFLCVQMMVADHVTAFVLAVAAFLCVQMRVAGHVTAFVLTTASFLFIQMRVAGHVTAFVLAAASFLCDRMRVAGHVTAFVLTTASMTCACIPFSLECEYVLAMHELESHIFNK
jgi:hypothetical protein